jgi:hypothetical protein
MRVTKLIVTICLVFIAQVTIGQVYQLMPQYGYQAPRMAFDSTIQIPTFCGVPTLKSVQFVTKKGAIAFDSCNNRFYTYNPKTLTWSQVSGGSTDTTSLSNRINLKIDSVKRRRDSVFAYRNGNEVFQFRDSVGGGSTDTTSLSSRINLKLDSLKRRADSVFGYRNGNEVFQFKDSVGSGGSASDTSKVVIAQVHNATATTLQKGEVVYLFGANGNVASVKRANNKQDSTSSKTFGIVRRDIASGQNGFITTQGQIEKLNLGSYSEGDILYLDSIDGQLTNVVPQAPYHSVFIGVVERANNGNGLMYVKVQNGYEIQDLHNVKVNGILNNQVLVYSDTQKVWKNRSIYTIVDTTSLSSRINLKFNTSDTSSLQQKSLPANSFMANNTTSQANPTSTTFKQFGNQTYSDSITITGTVNPSGAINHTFRWSQIGNLVTLHITLTYATNGSLSQVAMELPDGLPIPILPTGLSSNNDIICYGTGFMVSTTTGVSSVFSKVFLRQNTGLTNDYEIVINQATNSTYRIINTTIQYFAQ